MRLETNFVQTANDPRIINRVNSIAAAFGWTVQSIQVTDSQVAYSNGSFGWVTEYGVFIQESVKHERTTYANIVYQRDTEDPRHPDWVELESEYSAMEERSFLTDEELLRIVEIEKMMRKKYTRKSLLLYIKAIGCTLPLLLINMSLFPYLLLCWLAIGIGILVRYHQRSADSVAQMLEKNIEYRAIVDEAEQRKDEVRQEILDRVYAI